MDWRKGGRGPPFCFSGPSRFQVTKDYVLTVPASPSASAVKCSQWANCGCPDLPFCGAGNSLRIRTDSHRGGMAAPGNAAISISLEGYSGSGKVATTALLGAMLAAADRISDLVFSPGRPHKMQVKGHLIPVQVKGLVTLTTDDTRHMAADLIGDNKQAVASLREHGSCDISYGLAGVARFRVNIFIQRGSCAVVVRVISTLIPDLASLRLPSHLADVAKLRDGIVLVTGPA